MAFHLPVLPVAAFWPSFLSALPKGIAFAAILFIVHRVKGNRSR